MVKVSISLPNNAHITVESEEPEIIHEIVGLVLRDLPRDLMRATPPVNGEVGELSVTEKGTTVPGLPSAEVDRGTSPPPTEPVEGLAEDERAPRQPTESDAAVPAAPSAPERPQEAFTSGRLKAQQAARSAAAELAFIQFCQSVNPLGDMRKVVVAAEGANQFLEMDSVDAEELGRLFDRVGWLHPHNFTQTLRNAARSKFRWLERLPGRSGHYTVTTLGRSTTVNY